MTAKLTGTELFSGGELRELQTRFPRIKVGIEVRYCEVMVPQDKPPLVRKRIVRNYLAKMHRIAVERAPPPDDLDPSKPTFTADDIMSFEECFPMAKNIEGRIAHALRTWCSPERVPSCEERRKIIFANIMNADIDAQVPVERGVVLP